ncbi:PREDICTED: MICOS complex subunit Mic10-like [Priapulus caudatus]|uniref:MICOS complex subunit MIC10 n=1 Tax=Priapulus caudatus TaxID=37621 RepID=A0ABM1DPA8_PRICU|nr:PREDICTED: MICOS complex subunit Mic10-like [Priapulus caudatus]
MADLTRSEDQLGEKWDRCLSDTALKIAGGLGLGIVFSVFLFKRRPWPIAFGIGTGFGMGYSNCQHDFNQPYLLHGHRIRVKSTPPVDEETTTQ